MLSLNNVTTADTYTPDNTREQPETVFIDFTVTGAAISWNYKLPENVWSDDLFLPPTQRGIRINCRGVRVKSAVAGKPAQVTVYLRSKADLP